MYVNFIIVRSNFYSSNHFISLLQQFKSSLISCLINFKFNAAPCCTMDFNIADLHKKEEVLRSSVDQILKAVKIGNIKELNHAALMKCNKDTLANLVENLSKSLISNIDLCKSAAGTIDNVKSELIKVQKEQLQSVQETVQTEIKTEMKTWSDIARKNCANNAPTLKTMKKAVQSAVQEDTRSRNFIIHGVPEDYSKYPLDVAEEVLDVIWDYHNHPAIVAANHIGVKKRDDGRSRPIKVTLKSNESVKMALARAQNLKKSKVQCYHSWYIAPDRNREEQAIHHKLVAQLKEQISADPSKYHYIKDGKVLSVVSADKK